jgi:hypothetical protein
LEEPEATLWLKRPGPKLSSVVSTRALVIAGGVGAIYGLLALEAVSPLAIVLLIWAIATLVLAWRVPLRARVVETSASGFVIGFGIVWAIVLERQLATCKPVSCTANDPATDLLYALAFLAPMITLAGGEIGLRALLCRYRGTRA